MTSGFLGRRKIKTVSNVILENLSFISLILTSAHLGNSYFCPFRIASHSFYFFTDNSFLDYCAFFSFYSGIEFEWWIVIKISRNPEDFCLAETSLSVMYICQLFICCYCYIARRITSLYVCLFGMGFFIHRRKGKQKVLEKL